MYYFASNLVCRLKGVISISNAINIQQRPVIRCSYIQYIYTTQLVQYVSSIYEARHGKGMDRGGGWGWGQCT